MKYLPHFLLPLLISTPLLVAAPHVTNQAEEKIVLDQSQISKPATLKIMLLKDVDGAQVEVKGKFRIFNPAKDEPASPVINGRLSQLSTHIAGLKWDKEYPEVFQMRIVPASADSGFFLDGIQYPGVLEVYSIKGKLTFINELDVETYVKSVLSDQFQGETRKEVLEALAITIRTNLYYLISKNRDAFWHLDQGKVGYTGYLSLHQNQRASHVVDLTEKLVLTLDGKPFPAQWNENCAGKTASYKAIYRRNALCPEGVNAPFAERDRKKAAWKYSVSLDKLAETFGADEPIKSIDLFEDPQSQKVYALRLEQDGKHKDIDFFSLQKELSGVASNDFTVEVHGNQVDFKGYGKGNGLGLCLFSAGCMVKEGRNAVEILQYFFPGTKIEKVKDPIAQ